MSYDGDRDYDAQMDAAYSAWFDDQIDANLGEIVDERLQTIFRTKIETWAQSHWSERDGRALAALDEGQRLLDDGHPTAAVVFAATSAEIVLRDLTIRPILVGLFLGDREPTETIGKLLRRGGWLSGDVLAIAGNVLATVGDADVRDLLDPRPFADLTKRRNVVVHDGEVVEADEAARLVATADRLYRELVPIMRELCGVTS